MKKARLIEILNRIAKGKAVPYKIKYDLLQEEYNILVYDSVEQEYRYENDYKIFFAFIPHHLNDYVEILEYKNKRR